MRRIQVQEDHFDVGEEYRKLLDVSREVGAVALFVGAVRDINDGADVSGLYLEHYPGMTEKEIEKIIAEVGSRWSLSAVTVIHRIGRLAPGDEIVFAGVASRHRGDAFAACRFVMDFLKTRATFWKKERTPKGDRWLTTRQSDMEAVQGWNR